MKRAAVALGALILAVGALIGVRFSGATWTHDSNRQVDVQAAFDWTPPEVTLEPVPPGVIGDVTLTATVVDRSDIASVEFQYRSLGTLTWLTVPCPAGSGPSPLTHTCSWQTATVPAADYELRAVATDSATPTSYTAASAVALTQVVDDEGGLVLWPIPTPVSGDITVTAQFYGNLSRTADMYIERQTASGWVVLCQGRNTDEDEIISCAWDTTTVTDGSLVVRGRVTAGSDIHTDLQAVVVDNAGPTISSFTVPSGVLGGAVTLSASATDARGIADLRFEYRVQGAPTWSTCGTDTTSPYSCALNLAAVPDGSYEFRVVATDVAGNTTTSATETRTVSNAPAVVTITGPASGASVAGTVPVSVDAQSSRGIASVVVQYRQGSSGAFTDACTDTAAPYGCDWTTVGLPGGAYQLRAVLTEPAGGTVTSASVGVTLAAGDDGVIITSPAAGSTVTDQVTLRASGAAQTGVSQMVFQVRPAGETSWTTLCTDLNAPYTCVWNTSSIAWADYDLQAVMTKGNGEVLASSPPVPVKVDNVDGTLALASPTSPLQRQTVHLAADAWSDAPITQVQLQRRPTTGGDYETVCTLTVTPYACDVDMTATTYGTFEVRGVMTMVNGDTVTTDPFAIAVDNRVLSGYAIDASPSWSTTARRLTAGDTFTFEYAGLADLTTIRDGLTEGGTVSVEVAVDAADQLTLVEQGGAASPLGTVALGTEYADGPVVFAGTLTAQEAISTDPANPGPVTLVTLTLGSVTSGETNLRTRQGQPAFVNLSWTPGTAVEDLFGLPISSSTVTETGELDIDA